MSQAPTFSVIIAAHNAESTIEATIRSVITQTRQDFEIIVVDDGSSDGTAARVEALRSKTNLRLVRQDNRGPGPARNAGINAANGRYVSMLDSDDLWLPTYLKEMHDALDAAPDTRFGYTDAWDFDEVAGRFKRATTMALQRPPREVLTRERFLAELMQRNFVYNSITVRSSVMEQVGGYADLPRAQDYDLWLRLTIAGYPGLPVKGPLAVYRVRPDSLSTDREAVYASLRNVYARMTTSDNLSPELRSAASRRLAEVSRAPSGDMRRQLATWRERMPRLLQQVRLWTEGSRWLPEPPAQVAEAFPELAKVCDTSLKRAI